MRLGHRQLEALESLFGQEIESALTGKILPSLVRLPVPMVRNLTAKGLITTEQVVVGHDCFSQITVRYHMLTHRGRMVYCESCTGGIDEEEILK